MNLISLLYETQDSYISGEHLSNQLSITRGAVWKQVAQLRKKGVDIESSQSLGYKLISTNHYIDQEVLESKLPNHYIEIHETLDSTNQKAKLMEHKPALIIAHHQTDGRGRRGKSFYSPKNQGIYFSYIPQGVFSTEHISQITIKSSIALHHAIKDAFNIDTKIKWLNDIYIGDLKCAGILVEASLELQTYHFEKMIIGVGLNLTQSQIPQNLKDIYTSLDLDQFDLHLFFERFIHHFETLPDHNLIEMYKSHSMILGRQVIHSETQLEYQAKDIDQDGNLILENSKGEILQLSFGEVSLKIK